MPLYKTVVRSRRDYLDSAQGVITQPFDMQTTRSSAAMTDGSAYFQSIYLHAGEIVTNVHLMVISAGSGMTLSKVGLYDKNGARLAISADQGTNWQSTGMKNVALSAAYTVLTGDIYYLAVVAKASSILPSLLAASAQTPAPTTTGKTPSAVQTGQTDLPSSATFANTNGLNAWLGCS